MHFRQSLVEWVWLVLATLVVTLLNGPGVEASICPDYFPFVACPRPGDLIDDTVCCKRNGRYTCCTSEYIKGWGIALIVIGAILVFSLVTTAICLCCRKKRKRQAYTVLRDDLPPQQATAGTIIVVPGPPPPPGPGQYGYNYNTMAYPPSNVSLPPVYEPVAPPAAKPATPAPVPAAQPTTQPPGNDGPIAENEEDAL